jgi:hypothetical protein
VSAGDDVPAGVLYIQAFAGQLFGRLITPTAIKNVFTARNLVEDSARAVLDAVGFVFARGYAVEIVQFVAPDLVDDRVFGVDVPALEKLATGAGLTMGHLLNLMSTPSTWFFRRALGDFREALRNPTDTGFFCYRAIETLMQEHASRTPSITDKRLKWTNFRTHYGFTEEQILYVKRHADPVRHGNGLGTEQVSSDERMKIFEAGWNIGIAVLMRAHGDLTPADPPAEWVKCPVFAEQRKGPSRS